MVVIGASAGGVETLRRVVSGLPPDLAATVCIVLHLAPDSPSALPAILRRATPLPCRTAVDGEQLRAGEILVAPPDRHLEIADGAVMLTVGPRENGHRPSVDVLFRTAAAAQDGNVIGVVLSGTRDDGTAGLARIKANGGSAIVQDPGEALYPGMPANAIANVSVDTVVPSDRIADAIVKMVNGEHPIDDPPEGGDPGSGPSGGPAGHPPAVGDPPAVGEPVTSVCPDCGGVLTEDREAGVMQWRCRVGHRYSSESLVDAQADLVEEALWAAIRALEDRRALLSRMSAQFESGGQHRSARWFERSALQAARQAQAVRAALATAAATTLRRVDDDAEGADDEAADIDEDRVAG